MILKGYYLFSFLVKKGLQNEFLDKIKKSYQYVNNIAKKTGIISKASEIIPNCTE